jgi:hypothetical protein
MIQNLIGPLKARIELSAMRMACLAAAYAALGIAGLFGLVALFVWLAHTNSLLFACLVFAGAFVVIGVGALIYASVLERRRLRAQAQTSTAKPAVGALLLANPNFALNALRGLRVLKRAPMLSLGGAIAAGLALAFLGPYRSNNRDEA